MNNKTEKYFKLFTDWSFKNMNDEEVALELRKKGMMAEQVDEIKEAYKKHCKAARSKRGMVLMIVGGFIGFLSCVLTLSGVLPEYQDFILIGLTTLGVGIAFCGCYCVFE